jgi:hypothetical protein
MYDYSNVEMNVKNEKEYIKRKSIDASFIWVRQILCVGET